MHYTTSTYYLCLNQASYFLQRISCSNKFQYLKHEIFNTHLVSLSIMPFILVSETAGNNFWTISRTNKSLIPGLARSANSNAFFSSSIASVLWEDSGPREL